MAPSLSETETDKSCEFVSIKFLLKQVYAAHTAAVKDLESEIQSLKEQLEDAKQAVSSSVNCEKCKKLESAYTACKEEYKNAVLEQTRRLKEFESMFDLNNKQTNTSKTKKCKETIKTEVLLESPNERYCLTDNNYKCKEISPKSNIQSKHKILNECSSVFEPSKNKHISSKKEHSNYFNSEVDDSILVPDTEGFGLEDKSPKNKGKKRKSDKTSTKENSPDLEDYITQIPSSFKKRALSERKNNELESSNNDKIEVTSKNNLSPKSTSNTKTNSPTIHNPKRSKVSEINGKWAENLNKDFGISVSSKSNIVSPKENVSIQEISDDDFDIKPSEDNSSWKTSVRKKEVKKLPGLKTIKSTSKFQLTLEAPNPNEKKNFKQTKLSKNSFVAVRQSTKNFDQSPAIIHESVEEKSGMADVSEIASLAKSRSSLPDLGSETFCPLELISHSKSLTNETESAIGGPPKEPEANLDDVEVFSDSVDSFDQLPTVVEPNYKYKEDPVREKNKRKQLDGHDCKECEKYYSDLGLSDAEKKDRMKQCSRHRAKYVPPSTPEHFWEIEFPNTEVCKARGYVAETQNVKLQSRRRRPLQSK